MNKIPIPYFINKIANFTYIYNIHLDDFLKFNIPCKECYLQTMCLEDSNPGHGLYSISMRSCERLEDYVNNSESFVRLNIKNQTSVTL